MRLTWAIVAALGLAAVGRLAASRPPEEAPAFPAGAEHWIGQPQSLESLRGRVVLLDVWTFG